MRSPSRERSPLDAGGRGGPEALIATLRRGLEPLPDGSRPVRLLVAVSGGADSITLLHLLRFGLRGGAPGTDRAVEVEIGHIDHGMRPGSRDDADWLRGVARSWGVPLHAIRLADPPTSEASAREARLAALERMRDGAGLDLIVTAHHRGDQAETVLFRAVRGTGVTGLAGIPRARGVWRRPLLEVDPAALRAWAAEHGLRWREDPTNRDGSNVRSRLRTEVLPILDELAPGTVDNLARLSGHAARHRTEVEALADVLLDSLLLEDGPGRIALDAPRLSTLPAVVRPLLLRRTVERLGLSLDAASTGRILAHASELGPGSRLDLRRGAVLHVAHDRWILSEASQGQGESTMSMRSWLSESIIS